MFASYELSSRLSRSGSKPTPTGNQSPVERRATRRVLVVEDNLDAVHSLAFLLKDEGHVVEFAINGYVALDLARKFRPDIVLLDLGLPGLDGFEVCRQLKSDPELQNIRVVAVTALSSPEDRAKAGAVGCDLHIAKPYDPLRLLALVRYL